MTDSPWQVAQAVAQRNGLDVLTVYIHANAHHDGNPLDRGWVNQLETAAACLHSQGLRPTGALVEVTS